MYRLEKKCIPRKNLIGKFPRTHVMVAWQTGFGSKPKYTTKTGKFGEQKLGVYGSNKLDWERLLIR